MTIWSLLYYSIFLFYIFSGIYVWSLNKKASVNRYFFWMCLTLAAWSLGFSMSISSSSALEASKWLPLSTFGWTFFYTPLFLFILSLTNSPFHTKKHPYIYAIYLAPIIFYWRFVNYNTGTFIQTPYGWIYTLYAKGLWSYAFDVYYVSMIIATFVCLIHWQRTTDSPREKQQGKIIQTSLFGAFVFGALTDTFLPMFGLQVIPFGVIFCAIAVLGLWRAITKYKMMYLTQEIAAEHVLVTMKDPVIVTNRKYNIGYMNSAAEEIIGQNSSVFIGLPIHTILPELTQSHPCYRSLDTQGHSSGHTLDLISYMGPHKAHLCSAVNAYTEFGEKTGVVFVLHDISERITFENQLQSLNATLTKKVNQINHIFDHVHEGIFTFKSDLIIQAEYSHVCYDFFGGPIDQRHVCDLLYPNSDEQVERDFLESLLNQLFTSNEKDRMRYCPLLPEVLSLGERTVEITFEYTFDSTKTPIMMVILSDATERYALQNQLSKERQTMEMAIKTLRYSDDFTELVHDYKQFASSCKRQYQDNPLTVSRSIHTYRGNFSQFSLVNLVSFLEHLEQLIQSGSTLDLEILSETNFIYHLELDLDLIRKTTGVSPLLKDELLLVDKKLLASLESTIINSTSSPLTQALLNKLNQLHYKSIKSLLTPLIDYTMLLAQRHRLAINPFTIQGDDLLVDFRYYQDFIKSMTHLFRNIVAHAIEPESERINQSKTPLSNIHFTLRSDNDHIYITLSDDGRGIDFDKVKKTALAKGLLTENSANNISEEDLANYLTKDYFTTKATHSSHCGFGVGLSAVNQEIANLHGTLEIRSKHSKGTTISIKLPNTHAIKQN